MDNERRIHRFFPKIDRTIEAPSSDPALMIRT